MIFQILELLTGQLNSYYTGLEKPSGLDNIPTAILKNISLLDDEALQSTNNIILTLVNISEESTMKNNPAHAIRNNQMVEYNNPTVNLNLYVLFSLCMTNYDHALIYLSHTINYFQGMYTFNRQNSVSTEDGLPDDFYVIMDLHSLTFEQTNFLWSTLGGKQHPFVLYRLRLLQMQRKSTMETRGTIKQVRIDEKENS
ncbi:MAG: DUF4255 domain-containing protein [Bacteroidales bacterium]|nr:DUF4255 domain-containing protein [Bacteroidales bacterium]